jgi:hypothetical protein
VTDPGDCWTKLRAQIEGDREASHLSAQAISNAILRTLKIAALGGHCSRNVEGWLRTKKTEKGLREISLSTNADAKDNKERPAIKLSKLVHLEDGATLAFKVVVSDRAPKGIRAYTASLQGTARQSRALWYARIDLTEEPEGKGLCAHALLHCHMGSRTRCRFLAPRRRVPSRAMQSTQTDHNAPGSSLRGGHQRRVRARHADRPQRTRIFSPRVPLPWLEPWEALQWLLATVEPSLEPSPERPR